MRLFVAINLPAALKKQLAEMQNEIKNSFPMEMADAMAKWVEPENLHLTLLFLGEVREQNIVRLVGSIQEVAQSHPPLILKIEMVCYGPDKQTSPRLIWLGIEKNEQLKKLADDLRELYFYDNLAHEKFIGHITLARIKEWVWKKIEPEERPEIERGLNLKIEVRSIELMESRLKRKGPEYVILRSFPLLGIT